MQDLASYFPLHGLIYKGLLCFLGLTQPKRENRESGREISTKTDKRKKKNEKKGKNEEEKKELLIEEIQHRK